MFAATMYSNSPTNQSTPGIINNNHLNSNVFHQNQNEHISNGNQQNFGVKDGLDCSEGTVETLLTLSPSEHPGEHNCKCPKNV